MSVHVIVGSQWGDEGKGKIVDHLSEHVDIVARYQGGANAGHTVVIGEQEYILHLIPSGIFTERVTCVIGNGVVVDPAALLEEIEMLRSFGLDIRGRLLISHNAHLIMPYHKLLDKLREEQSSKIGTTGRGIGPAYIDKFSRTGIRIVDLLDRDILGAKIKINLEEKNKVLKQIYGEEELDVDSIIREYREFDKQIDEFITDTSYYLNSAIRDGKKILAEGAQGALLDIDHGTYPYVTSSNPTSGGACTGLGIPPTAITKITGIVKAYTTRVGNGPFPSELTGDEGERLRTWGNEYGATTGRPRRCGWFDAVLLAYSARVNGIQEMAITKLDVLSHLDEIPVCKSYTVNGKPLKTFPTDERRLGEVKTVYETLPGWKQSLSDVRTFDDLPENARRYIFRLEELTGIPVRIISVGARRDQTLFKDVSHEKDNTQTAIV
jgi:adenylosuccinate synthase